MKLKLIRLKLLLFVAGALLVSLYRFGDVFPVKAQEPPLTHTVYLPIISHEVCLKNTRTEELAQIMINDSGQQRASLTCNNILAQSAAAPGIEPCSATYTLSRDDNQFYILYVGTTAEICQDFCANLQDCTVH